MKIAGFCKLRNEIVRGNLARCLANLEAVCDGGIVCDDASTDGTAEVLAAFVNRKGPTWTFMRVSPEYQDFTRELEVKQKMLELLAQEHAGDLPEWIWWLDGDETLDARGTAGLRAYVAGLAPDVKGVRFHYTQLWRNASWARTDGGFDEGVFLKLWRYEPGLSFDPRPGTHRSQFPMQLDYTEAPYAPFEIIHWGNYGKALQFKGHQYHGGLGGADRHIAFGHTPAESLAPGVGYDVAKWSEPHPTYRRVAPEVLPPQVIGEPRTFGPEPEPFSLDAIRCIRAMGNLRHLAGWFTVVIPAFNRAATLPRALKSLQEQRYEKWIALVLDDGSTDETIGEVTEIVRHDPRFLYCRYEENRGGVAMNEIGMAMAVEMTEWWSRLGSDDWWGPGKLEADAAALAEHEAVYGPFTVWKHGKADHICAGSWGPERGTASQRLLTGEFLASWANVAVRTSVLARVREHFGSFCDARLHSMEDFLCNARIATMAEWGWHPGDPADAVWLCLEDVGAPAEASASANAERTARDHKITLEIIRGMR